MDAIRYSYMKTFILLILLLGVTFNTVLSARLGAFTYEDVLKFLSGFLRELGSDVENIHKCEDSIIPVRDLVLHTIEVYHLIDWKNYDTVFHFLSTFCGLISDLPMRIVHCARTPADVIKVMNKLGQLNLNILIQRFIDYYLEFIEHALESIDDWEGSNYEGLGGKLGYLIHTLFLQNNRESIIKRIGMKKAN